MTTYRTPDVYIEEISVFPPSVAEVGTAIPAFVGYTELSDAKLTNKPTKIFSMKEFEALYGLPKPENLAVTLKEVREGNTAAGKLLGYEITERKLNGNVLKDGVQPAFLLYYAVKMFFDNGGAQCYVVSVGSYPAAVSATALSDGLKAVELEDEPTLLVVPDAVKFVADKASDASYNTSLAGYQGIVQEMLAQSGRLRDRFAIIDIHGGDDPKARIDLVRGTFGTSNLKYGAAYYPFLKTTFNVFVHPGEGNVKVTINGPTGTVVKRDNTDMQDIELHLLRTGRLANPNAQPNPITEIKPDTLAYNLVKAELAKYFVTVPPSGAVAGVYAATDATRGVWKAPANVSLADVLEPSIKVDNLGQEDLNIDVNAGKSINAIRAFAGKGTLVWGARTLAGNDNEWRYISVRRFFNMAEESIKKSTYWAVFEPNDANTWTKVRGMIENYLTDKWRDGALAGATPKDAFFVKCGLGTTMTAQDILQGKMIVEIGMAVVRPAEFIILTFSHKMQTS